MFFLSFLFLLTFRSMKAKLMATYPDAFPNDSASNILDQRPDLERPLWYPFRELHWIPEEDVYNNYIMFCIYLATVSHGSFVPFVFVGVPLLISINWVKKTSLNCKMANWFYWFIRIHWKHQYKYQNIFFYVIIICCL